MQNGAFRLPEKCKNEPENRDLSFCWFFLVGDGFPVPREAKRLPYIVWRRLPYIPLTICRGRCPHRPKCICGIIRLRRIGSSRTPNPTDLSWIRAFSAGNRRGQVTHLKYNRAGFPGTPRTAFPTRDLYWYQAFSGGRTRFAPAELPIISALK